MLLDEHGCPVFLEPADKKALRWGAIRHCLGWGTISRIFLPGIGASMLIGAVSALCTGAIRDIVRIMGVAGIVYVWLRLLNRRYFHYISQEVARRNDICGSCGYHLVGGKAQVCPECGDPNPLRDGMIST